MYIYVYIPTHTHTDLIFRETLISIRLERFGFQLTESPSSVRFPKIRGFHTEDSCLQQFSLVASSVGRGIFRTEKISLNKSCNPLLITATRCAMGQASTDDAAGTKYPLPNTHCATSAPEFCWRGIFFQTELGVFSVTVERKMYRNFSDFQFF